MMTTHTYLGVNFEVTPETKLRKQYARIKR